MKKNRIALVAGRSGGHIIPGMTLAKQYKAEHPDAEIIVFCTHSELDKKIVAEHTHVTRTITISLDNIPNRWYHYPKFLYQFGSSITQSFFWLIRARPNYIILMGGYVSIPVAIAAMILRIPRHVYELNVVPGKATKLLAPISNTINVCFKTAQSKFKASKTKLCNYPIRFSLPKFTRDQVTAQLGLDLNKKTVLILGGSQGSLFLNNVLYRCLQEFPQLADKINIIHQTGAQDTTDWATYYQQLNIKAIVFDYHHDMAQYYTASDIIISRAGAGSIFEALFFKKPCILVPLEIQSNDHQVHNAQAIAQEYPQFFSVIRQQELGKTSKTLFDMLNG